MKFFAMFLIPAALVAGLCAIVFYQPSGGIPSDTKRYLPSIEQQLRKEIPVCIEIDSEFEEKATRRRQRGQTFLNSPFGCLGCQRFAELGLVEKRSDSTTGFGGYVMTDLGRQAYQETDEQSRHGTKFTRHSFCFGKMRLKEILETSSPLPKIVPGKKLIFVNYTMEVVNPHPLLHSPKLTQADHLPVLLPNSNVTTPRLATFEATYDESSNEVAFSESSVLINRWINIDKENKRLEAETLQQQQSGKVNGSN